MILRKQKAIPLLLEIQALLLQFLKRMLADGELPKNSPRNPRPKRGLIRSLRRQQRAVNFYKTRGGLIPPLLRTKGLI